MLGEALAASGARDQARAAYARALALATAARDAGEPEAARWLAEARSKLAKTAVR